MKYPFDSIAYRNYIRKLFSIWGCNHFEIKKPADGWPNKISTSFYVDADGGKFFIENDGKISYKSKFYHLMNWSYCPKEMIELAVDQFSLSIKEKIIKQTARSRMPNIEMLMCKYYNIE